MMMNTAILVPAAKTFVAEVDAAYPHRGTDSDGSVASSEHHAANPTSDHEPGPKGSPSPGLVDAADLDADLVPGDKAASQRAMYDDVIPSFEAHPGTQYWIFNDQICHRAEGWKPRSYAYAGPGRNRHTKHGHFNWQETRAAHRNTSPYGIKGVSTDMDLTDKVGNTTYPTRTFKQFINDLWQLRDVLVGDPKTPGLRATTPLARLLAMPTRLETVTTTLAALDRYERGRPSVYPMVLTPADRAAIVAEVSAAVIAALPEYGPRKNTP